MAMPIGISLANPGQLVFSMVGDGSAMYSISALWTAAHHKLPIVWAVLNNRSYRILKENVLRRHLNERGTRHFVAADLIDPVIDFVAVARGFGVTAARVSKPTDIRDAFRAAVSAAPSLLEIDIAGDMST
jgi:benzoylformate decarboxylase